MASGAKYTEDSVDESILEERNSPDVLPKWRVVLLQLSFFAYSATCVALSVVVLPAHIQAMVGDVKKGRAIGGLVAGTAVLMFLLGPPVGMWSDRLVCRLGKRRPIMIASVVLLCASLVGLAFSAPYIIKPKSQGSQTDPCHVDLEAQRCMPYTNTSTARGTHSATRVNDDSNTNNGNLALYVFFYLMTAGSLLCFTIPYNALIADMSRQDERGFNSGVMGFMILTGNLCGALLGLFFVRIGIFALCGILVAIYIVCTTATVLSVTELPGKQVHQPIDLKEVFFGFWAPLKDHDFRWVFVTRFLMQQGIATVLNFYEYWLDDMAQLPHCLAAHEAISLLLMPLYATAAIGSVVCGILSDRLRRRKLFVVISSLMMFAVSVAMSSVKGNAAFVVAAISSIVFGVSYGAYTSVDYALVMDVLPAKKDKAKDLAVWHQALILPQALATPVGGVVLDVFERVNCQIGLGYILLFVISSLYFLLSGLFIMKIRNAR